MRKVGGALLIIILLVGLFLIGRHVPFGAGNSVFYFEDTKAISRISIMAENNSVNLEKRDNTWYINGKYPARREAIESLLAVIRDIRIKSPVSDEVFRQVLGDSGTRQTDIRIYDGKKTVQSFQVFSNPSVEVPTIFRKGARAKPFLVHIPAYELDPGSFFVAGEKAWMPTTLFQLSPHRIRELHLDYFETPDSSFSIRLEGGGISFTSRLYPEENIDTMAVGRYLSYFTYVPFESWAMDLGRAEIDSIMEGSPYLRLELVSNESDTINLMTWTRKIQQEGSKTVRDTDRLWGSINGEDLLIIKYYDLDPLVKGPSYFISD